MSFCVVVIFPALYFPISTRRHSKRPADSLRVTVSNVVGYSDKGLASGRQAVGGSFLGIGTNGCFLTQITVKGVTKSNAAISIQKLGSEGQATATYNYYKGATAPHKTDGWYIGTGATRITSANDVFFKAGTGLWVKGADASSFTFSGEVLDSNWPVTLAAGRQMLSNPFPAATSLTKIEVSGITKSNAAISIQKLGSEGQATATYNYYKGATAPHKTDGWYVGTGATRITEANDITINVGEGLWVKGADGAVLTFKKPF